VPAEQRDRLLNAWRRHQSAAIDVSAQRLRLRRKLARLREVYLEGDLDKAAYQAQKAAVSDSLASLPAGGDRDNCAGKRLANFLADVSAAWRVATSDERNRLARQLFTQAVIENKTVVAVVPRPELAHFFDVVKRGYGGSDGDRTRTCVMVSKARSSSLRRRIVALSGFRDAKAISDPVRANLRSWSGTLFAQRPTAGALSVV
jgi:hypothetical protein